MIHVSGLRKSFDVVTAVDGVSFDVRAGELFGFLGPNGAGKTTTINMLSGLSRPDAGTVCIAGRDCTAQPKAAQNLIGVVPDESNLYPELSGYQNLCFCAALYGIPKRVRQERARELLAMFGLESVADRLFDGYSKGMKRKLTIAAALIHRPLILFLDEPTSGIDVASARQIRQLIADLQQEGTTIFLTTHYIEEAERLCERIAFIVHGRLARVDTLHNLLQPVRDHHVLLLSFASPIRELDSKLGAAFPRLHIQASSPKQLRLESSAPFPLGPLVKYLESEKIELIEARRVNPSLEEVFVEITGMESVALTEADTAQGGPA